MRKPWSQCMLCGRDKGMTRNASGSDECLIRLDIGCQVMKDQITCKNSKVTSSQQSKRQNCGGTSVREARNIELKRTWGNGAGVWSRGSTAVKQCIWRVTWIRANSSKPLSEHRCSGIIRTSYQIRLSRTQNHQAASNARPDGLRWVV